MRKQDASRRGLEAGAIPEAGDFVVVRLYIGKYMFTLLLFWRWRTRRYPNPHDEYISEKRRLGVKNGIPVMNLHGQYDVIQVGMEKTKRHANLDPALKPDITVIFANFQPLTSSLTPLSPSPPNPQPHDQEHKSHCPPPEFLLDKQIIPGVVCVTSDTRGICTDTLMRRRGRVVIPYLFGARWPLGRVESTRGVATAAAPCSDSRTHR